MILIEKKVEILKAVANGSSLSGAGSTVGVSAGSARNALNRLCQVLELSPLVKDIKANPEQYLKKAEELKSAQKPVLRPMLTNKLVSVLKVKDKTQVTPRYLSNITASQLMENGISWVAVTEIQEWLSSSGLSLKPTVPDNDEEIKHVKRAIAVLDAFYFDTELVKEQLNNVIGY